MNQHLIEKICGPIPDNFIKAEPKDSSYVFTNDPNFNPLNLYDFFGRGATVNSLEECFYYVELGFEQNKFTIFDLLQTIGVLFFAYFFIKVGVFEKLFKLLSKIKSKIFENLKYIDNYFEFNSINKSFVSTLFLLLLLLKGFLSFEIVKNKSSLIPPFIDEYITLASNVNFFKTLDFNAGNFIGGNYSPNITSGIISAVGKVVGWELTKDFVISRYFNFLWIVMLQILFFFILSKVYKSNSYFLILVSSFTVFLIPWWQGSLYGIGEIPSTIVFVNSIFLFNKYRKTSIILFSISILFGKTLLFLPFFFFYLVYFLKERTITKSFQDIILFLSPSIPWLYLVKLKYPTNSVKDYLVDQLNFILGHQTSGLNSRNTSFFSNFYQTLLESEFGYWNTYEKIRVIIIPLIFLQFIYLNRKLIDQFFGYITIPLMTSFISIYLWFFIINTTKWIRHSQHYTIVLIITILYLLNFKIIKNRIHIFVFASCLIYYIDNQKNLIAYFVLIIFFVIFLNSKFHNIDLLKATLVTLLFIEFLIPVNNRGVQETNSFEIQECVQKIDSDNCRIEYLNRK